MIAICALNSLKHIKKLIPFFQSSSFEVVKNIFLLEDPLPHGNYSEVFKHILIELL